MLETDLGWAAGFIDGEGSISIFRCNGKTWRSADKYRLELEVTQCDTLPLERLKEILGGYIEPRRQRLNPNWSPAWRWKLRGWTTIPVLQLLMPYLVVKRPQAELALKFYRNRQTMAGAGAWYKAEMGKLNVRGRARHVAGSGVGATVRLHQQAELNLERI